MDIPVQYQWLLTIGTLPKMVQEGLKVYGVHEIKGKEMNPEIKQMAIDADVADIYTSDDLMAWCGVSHSAIAIRAGKVVPFVKYDRLRAISFLKFGDPVEFGKEMLGDTLVFLRPGGAHVGIYIGEDSVAFFVMGGNEADEYQIVRIPKIRLAGARRPVYKSGQPATVKKYMLQGGGQLSTNEK